MLYHLPDACCFSHFAMSDVDRSLAKIAAVGRLDSGSPVPLYQQMLVQLHSRIASGEFGPGDVFLTERVFEPLGHGPGYAQNA